MSAVLPVVIYHDCKLNQSQLKKIKDVFGKVLIYEHAKCFNKSLKDVFSENRENVILLNIFNPEHRQFISENLDGIKRNFPQLAILKSFTHDLIQVLQPKPLIKIRDFQGVKIVYKDSTIELKPILKAPKRWYQVLGRWILSKLPIIGAKIGAKIKADLEKKP